MNWLLHPDKKFEPGEDWIYYAEAVYGQDEIDAVVNVLKENWLGNGKYTDEFEEKMAKEFGKKFGLFVNSGSSANLLALEICNFPKGAEIITPALTFGTTMGPIIMKELMPVVVDSKLATYNLDLDLVESAITEKTAAIMVPHAVGSINDMVRLREICDKHKLKLIEDSCDTHGSRFKGKPTGNWSDITTTSFYASHNMTAGGGGGMVMVDDPELKRRAKIFRDWGRALPERYEHYEGAFEERYNFKLDNIDYDGKFVFMELGYNMKAVEMQAAFGLAQLKRLGEFNKLRKGNFEKLFAFFKQYEKYFILPETLPDAEIFWLTFPLTIREESGIVRKEMLKFFETHKIQTRLLFAGNLLRHPAYKKMENKFRVATSLDKADYVMRNTFLVGCHHGNREDEMNYIFDTIKKFLASKNLD